MTSNSSTERIPHTASRANPTDALAPKCICGHTREQHSFSSTDHCLEAECYCSGWQDKNALPHDLLSNLEHALSVPGVGEQDVERILDHIEQYYDGWPCMKCDGPANGRWRKELRLRLRDAIDAEVLAFLTEKR